MHEMFKNINTARRVFQPTITTDMDADHKTNRFQYTVNMDKLG